MREADFADQSGGFVQLRERFADDRNVWIGKHNRSLSNTACVSATGDTVANNNCDTEDTNVNAVDLAITKTDNPDPVAAGSTLGPSAVLLTRGDAGATVISPGRETTVEAPKVGVVDTIGAGDAFGGGFLAWWHGRGFGREELGDHDAVVEAARFAVRVAAITCTRAGADPPHRAELVV